MISRRPLHGFPAAVDRGFIIAGARCRMTHSQQKYTDVEFTVIQQDPEIPNAEVETVVARRKIPAQCFAPGLSDKRQIVVAGRISRHHSLDKLAKAIFPNSGRWVQERLHQAMAAGMLSAKAAAALPVLRKKPSLKKTMKMNIGNLLG